MAQEGKALDGQPELDIADTEFPPLECFGLDVGDIFCEGNEDGDEIDPDHNQPDVTVLDHQLQTVQLRDQQKQEQQDETEEMLAQGLDRCCH